MQYTDSIVINALNFKCVVCINARRNLGMYLIKDLQELKEFVKQGGDYMRLGHVQDADVLALRKAIDDVVANVGVPAALGVIEEAIGEAGWLTAVIGDHCKNDLSFQRAEVLRVGILGGIRSNNAQRAFMQEYQQYRATRDVRELLDELVVRNESIIL